MSEDDERFVHRIEAFSDIVIGFTLAQVGAALVFPRHPADLVDNWLWLLTFAWTFAIVCLMWWMHNLVFRTVFYPSRSSLLVNFSLLATIVILLYVAEVMGRTRSLEDMEFAQHLYNAVLGLAFGLVALLSYLGVHAQRATMEPLRALRGRRAAVHVACAAAFIIAVDAASLLLGVNYWLPLFLGLSIPFGFFVGRLVARIAGFSEP